MSAYVCMNNRTFSCIIELMMKYEKVTNPDLLAQRLYLLNVESVNLRYKLKETAPDEYRSYIAHLADVRYEPQPDLHDAQRIKVAHCWMYQSCEGQCWDDCLYKDVQTFTDITEFDLAKKIAGNAYHPKDAGHIVYRFIKENNLEDVTE